MEGGREGGQKGGVGGRDEHRERHTGWTPTEAPQTQFRKHATEACKNRVSQQQSVYAFHHCISCTCASFACGCLMALTLQRFSIPWLLELRLDMQQECSPKKPLQMLDIAIAMVRFIFSMLIPRPSDMSEQF